MVTVAGVDLRGSDRRPSGVAVISGRDLRVESLYSDEEIVDFLTRHKALVVAIDSPLSHSPSYRHVDRVMVRLGFRVLPPGWRGMSMLVERGVRLASRLSSMGVVVLETHPRSALKSSKCRGLGELASRLGLALPGRLTRDEEDAVVASAVSLMYVEGAVVEVEGVDGRIYLLPPVCGGSD